MKTRKADTNEIVGEALKKDEVWECLEYIYDKALEAKATEVAGLLNIFSSVFLKYGLGPEPSTNKADYTKEHEPKDDDSSRRRMMEFILRSALKPREAKPNG